MMMFIGRYISALGFSVFLIFVLFCTSIKADKPIIAGYVEHAWFENNTVSFRAKLDTGAKNSSINAPDYEVFKKGGKEWVSFQVKNSKGKSFVIERPIVRNVTIRRPGVRKKVRPVILLFVCVAGKSAEVEFNLTDRKRMNYQVLIGRSFLEGNILVNAGKTFIASKRCK